MAFNGGGGCGFRWRQQRSMSFDGVGDGLLQEDESVVQVQATQQPVSTMRGQEGDASRGQQEMMARQPAGVTIQRDNKRAAR